LLKVYRDTAYGLADAIGTGPEKFGGVDEKWQFVSGTFNVLALDGRRFVEVARAADSVSVAQMASVLRGDADEMRRRSREVFARTLGYGRGTVESQMLVDVGASLDSTARNVAA
jgi:hypothetical protein